MFSKNKPLLICFLPLVHNLSNGYKFDLQDNERVRKSQFHLKGFAPRLLVKQR